ncbi:hypothetical protein C8R41DRAFT_298145 [Lentinula lateritia]|uniref:Rhodopsin domain-containing protein n=1 Tax=Lentinula lateritia TaxID=40482 RepID=A0ABQ8VHV9_9AGAR|nr:hypothetical protein C8R41DRAFT_298145 [Lentinula lateritia]
MFLSQLLLIAMWIRTDTPGLGPLDESHSARIVAYWLVSISFTCTLWSARISLIFSVIRLIPPLFVLRRVSEWMAITFFLMWAGSLIQKTYICASDRSWYQLSAPQCHLGTDVAIVELVTDLFADVVLAAIPIRLLAGVGLSPDKRRMLYMMFCASLLTSMVSIIHAVFLLGPSGLLEAITAQAETLSGWHCANGSKCWSFVSLCVSVDEERARLRQPTVHVLPQFSFQRGGAHAKNTSHPKPDGSLQRPISF